jgi:hypothetical protein
MSRERDIKTLARRGVGERQIAQWLGIPQEQVKDVLAADRDGRDEALVDSFPASDPPSWPGQ